MHILILILDFLTAIAAFIAGFLWFKASRVKTGIEQIDAADGYHDEFVTLKHSLKKQSRMNAKAALVSCVAALLQGVVFMLGLLKGITNS
jgi:uncharacterized protein involved in cysteine biosynthesis